MICAYGVLCQGRSGECNSIRIKLHFAEAIHNYASKEHATAKVVYGGESGWPRMSRIISTYDRQYRYYFGRSYINKIRSVS